MSSSHQSGVDGERPITYEVIVVDNASTDGSATLVRESFAWVRLIENQENAGFARANNQAIHQSSGHYVLLLNSDTVVLPGSLEAMVGFMSTYPGVGVLGCQLLNEDGSPQGSFSDFPTLCSAWLSTDLHRHARPYAGGQAVEVDAVSGACLMVRREVVQEVGGLDEAFTLFAEEVDWCYRIRQAGWRVCSLPRVRLVHLLGQSRQSRSLFAYLHLHRSRLLFFRKHYGRLRAQMLRLGYLPVVLVKVACALLRSWLGAGSWAETKAEQNWRVFRWLLLEQDVLTEQRA